MGLTLSQPLHNMANIFLAAYLILIGLNILVDLSIASWVMGVLALIAGVLLLAERFGFPSRKK
jgi:uncharacterized membrane protein HdeD (DUF308 family)